MSLCECGCKRRCKNRFVLGHNNRINPERKRKSINELQTSAAIHKRMYERSNKKCVICGITEHQHKEKTFGRRLDIHCRDGNFSNFDKSNWETVCRKHHKILDIFDHRKINRYTIGVKGHV